MKYTKFKTKLTFTLGIYFLVWRYSIACGLRDDFGVQIDPGRELLLGLIPIYGAMRWWWFLKEVRATQQRVGMPMTISPGRAFWISSFWFGAGPYINRHINALYVFQAGRAAGAASTPIPATAAASQLGGVEQAV
jgi:hypothetical protein